jgi:DNA-binding SARP family transcriptional activator
VYSEAGRSASHERLAASIAARRPRLLTLWGPAGYEKRAFVRTYGAYAGTVIACDLDRRRDRDLARPVLDALVGRDRSRAVRSAADRLAQRRDEPFGNIREALRREWPRSEGPELLLLRDATGALSTPSGADLLAELIGTLPPERTLALTTRTPLPHALEQLVQREDAETVEPRELALSGESVRDLARQAGLDDDAADALHALTEGWPLVTRLLLMLVRGTSDVGPLLREITGLPRHTLLTYAGQRVVSALDEPVREAVVAAAVHPGATAAHLARVLGEKADAVLFRMWRLPFVTVDDDATFVHPDLSAMLRTRFTPLVDALYQRTLNALVQDGAHAVAARVALDNRDAERAAELLDAVPPYTTGALLPLADYERVLDRIERDLVTRYSNVWMATIAFRRFAVDRETYVREAETIYFCLPYTATPDKRAAALMHLASAYFNLGRIGECDALIDAALAGFAAEPTTVRSSLLAFAASLRGEQGMFSRARDLARQAAEISHHEFSETLVLRHIETNEAVAHGRYDRARLIFDELLRRRSHETLPLYYAYAACDAAVWAWVFGDDAEFAHYISTLESALTPGLEAGFSRMIEAAHGRPIANEDAYAWPVHTAMAQLYRLGHASDAAEALAAARAAAAAADERRDPMVQTVAHTALYVLDETARPASRAVLEAIADQVESDELRSAIAGVLSGGEHGILARFIQRRVLRARQERPAQLTIELLSARVVRDGEVVKLSSKELELLALLASTYGAVSRDRIGEALWEHLEPDEWPNNVKVTVSRLRKKLGVHDAIVSDEGNYRLSRAVDVDVRRYERIVRGCADRELDDAGRAALRSVLDAYAGGAVARYERFVWMQPILARMNDLACTAGLALAQDALGAERYDDALGFARTVVEIDAYNERASEMLMRIALRRGDPDAARREYRRHATALATELGAEPSHRLIELLRQAR